MDASPAMMAALVAQSLNALADGEEDVCCPHDCAGCEALLYLVLNDKLDEIVGLYVERAGSGWDWWDDESKTVKTSWLMDRWCDPQTCDGVKFLAEEHGKPVEQIIQEFNDAVRSGVPYGE